jgi:cobalt/nickel transport system permease protein
VGALFLRALERGERVYAAMVSRGYDGVPRTMHRFAWTRADSIAALVWLAALSGLAAGTRL